METQYNNWEGYYPNIDMQDPQQADFSYGNITQPVFDFHKPVQEQQSQPWDDFQKAQYELRVEPMEQGDGQEALPDGPLDPVTYGEMKYEQPYTPVIGNNNNNNNGYYALPQQANPWGHLEPAFPSTPAPLQSLDGNLMARVNEEIDELRKKEMAKKHSADYLERKEKQLIENTQLAGNLQEEAERNECENTLKEDNLKFAVETILIPSLGDNNFNIDITCYQKIEEKMEQILEAVNEEKNADEEFQMTVSNYKSAKGKYEQAVFDQQNKDTIPVFLTDAKGTRLVKHATLATRVNRTKKEQEMSRAAYNAAVIKFKIRRQVLISCLLDDYWNYFAPYLRELLKDPQQSLWNRMHWIGQTEKLQYIQQLLFNPG